MVCSEPACALPKASTWSALQSGHKFRSYGNGSRPPHLAKQKDKGVAGNRHIGIRSICSWTGMPCAWSARLL